MRAIEEGVRELLAAEQAERKAKLDEHRVHTVFKVGDEMLLLTKALFDAANNGKLRTRWPSLNASNTVLQRRMSCSPTVNIDRLKPLFKLAGAPPAPG